MNRGNMATKAVTTKPEPVGTAVLEQLAELDVESISPATARTLCLSPGSLHRTIGV